MYNQKQHLDELCDQIDAAVFSGDATQDPETRNMLRDYVGRWHRDIEEQDRLDAESDEFYVPPPKPGLKLPATWKVEYHVAGGNAGLEPKTTPGYLVHTPRVNGVASNTFVWAGADNPADRLLYLILSTHNPIETE